MLCALEETKLMVEVPAVNVPELVQFPEIVVGLTPLGTKVELGLMRRLPPTLNVVRLVELMANAALVPFPIVRLPRTEKAPAGNMRVALAAGAISK